MKGGAPFINPQCMQATCGAFAVFASLAGFLYLTTRNTSTQSTPAATPASNNFPAEQDEGDLPDDLPFEEDDEEDDDDDDDVFGGMDINDF